MNSESVVVARGSDRSTAIRLFLTCWIIYALHFATNIVREIYPAVTLGDGLSFDVSDYVGLHPDIFEIPGRGAFINNNPGASMFGAVPYALNRVWIDPVVESVRDRRSASGNSSPPDYESPWPMAREFYAAVYVRGLDIKLGLAAGVMQALGMAVLSALVVVVMFRVLNPLLASRRTSLWLALLFAFATPVFFRTAQLNQNLLVAHAVFLAFVLLWRPWSAASGPTRLGYLSAGLLSGWAVVCDYSAVVAVVALSGYAFSRWGSLPEDKRRYSDLALFALGGALGELLLAGYQWSSFGHPLYPAQHYMPAANFTNRGYRGFDWPQPDLLLDTAFGARFGLFVSSPLLVLALLPWAWRRPTRLLERRESWLVFFFFILFWLFCGANQYGRMQFNSGVRYMVPVVPFLFLIVAGVLVRLPRFVATVIGAATAYWSWCLSMYRDVEIGKWGVLNAFLTISREGVRLPWLTTLEQMGSVPGYVSNDNLALPILLAAGLVIWMIWRH